MTAIPKTRIGDDIFHVKQNSTRDPIEYQAVDVDQQVVSLVGATSVQIAWRLQSALSNTVVVKTATIVDQESGQLRYQWVSGDTAVAGDYYAVWRVTFADGTEQTFPTIGYQKFTIDAEL